MHAQLYVEPLTVQVPEFKQGFGSHGLEEVPDKNNQQIYFEVIHQQMLMYHFEINFVRFQNYYLLQFRSLKIRTSFSCELEFKLLTL